MDPSWDMSWSWDWWIPRLEGTRSFEVPSVPSSISGFASWWKLELDPPVSTWCRTAVSNLVQQKKSVVLPRECLKTAVFGCFGSPQPPEFDEPSLTSHDARCSSPGSSELKRAWAARWASLLQANRPRAELWPWLCHVLDQHGLALFRGELLFKIKSSVVHIGE